MKFHRKTFLRTTAVLAVAALFSLALRMYTYWAELEITSGFFRTDGIGCIIYNVIGFAVFGICLILSMQKGGEEIQWTEPAAKGRETSFSPNEDAFLTEEEETPTAPSENALPPFSGAISTWQGTLSAFATFLTGFGFLSYSLSFWTAGLLYDPYHKIFALLSALSGVYFLFSGVRNSSKKIPSLSFFALVPALWCTVRMVVEYRDLARFVNKTLYIGQFLFIISVLVFFLYQAQLLLGEKPFNRPNSYAFSALSVLFFGATCRLPQLIAVFGDKVAVDLVDASSLVIDLAITLLALIKVRTVLRTTRTIF